MATFVWDTSGMFHAARAERLDVLGDLAKGHRHVMTAAVLEEFDRYGLAVPVAECGWLEVVHVDGLADLACLVRWTAPVRRTARPGRGDRLRVGGGTRRHRHHGRRGRESHGGAPASTYTVPFG